METKEVRAHVIGEVERVGLDKSQLQILAGLTKLRQAACDPRLLGLPKELTDEDSGKLVALRELVANAVEGGHEILVFSQFVTMLKLIERALKDDDVTCEYLDGSTKDRSDRVDRFQNDPSCAVFLIRLKAGGTGLNLTAADTVIHFDPWWNPAVEQQATDRAHRIGRTEVVNVYRLVAAGTIEEKILQLKDKKRALVASVLSEDERSPGGESLAPGERTASHVARGCLLRSLLPMFSTCPSSCSKLVLTRDGGVPLGATSVHVLAGRSQAAELGERFRRAAVLERELQRAHTRELTPQLLAFGQVVHECFQALALHARVDVGGISTAVPPSAALPLVTAVVTDDLGATTDAGERHQDDASWTQPGHLITPTRTNG